MCEVTLTVLQNECLKASTWGAIKDRNLILVEAVETEIDQQIEFKFSYFDLG